MPRRSPPAAWPVSRAANRRSAKGPFAASKALPISSITLPLASVLPWHVVDRRALAAGPVGDRLARPRGAAALNVNDGDLTTVGLFVAAQRELERLLRRHPALDAVDDELAVHRVGGRLMRDNSNAAFASDNAVADRQGLGLHTEAEQARVFLHGDD